MLITELMGQITGLLLGTGQTGGSTLDSLTEMGKTESSKSVSRRTDRSRLIQNMMRVLRWAHRPAQSKARVQ